MLASAFHAIPSGLAASIRVPSLPAADYFHRFVTAGRCGEDFRLSPCHGAAPPARTDVVQGVHLYGTRRDGRASGASRAQCFPVVDCGCLFTDRQPSCLAEFDYSEFMCADSTISGRFGSDAGTGNGALVPMDDRALLPPQGVSLSLRKISSMMSFPGHFTPKIAPHAQRRSPKVDSCTACDSPPLVLF